MTSLVALQGGEIGYKAQTGIAVRTAFSTPERAGDDFKASVQVAFGDAQVFSGDLRALGAFGPGRGTVTFAHTVVGAIELLYLHLLEMSLRGNHEIAIRLGILEISGSASNLSTITDVLMGQDAATLRQRRDDCDVTPLFYGLTPFGAFPAAGYGYFYGFNAMLVERDLDGTKA